MPCSYQRTNASRTARLSPSSSVKRSRSQSQLAPRRRSCSVMRLPYFCFHSQVRRRNSSRPTASRLVPSLSNRRSTWSWVAIPAWSEPGTHSAARPVIRAWRIIRSSSETNSACPWCSAPVTLGGGMLITYGSASGSAISGLNQPLSSHQRYNRCSVDSKSYVLGISSIGFAAISPSSYKHFSRSACQHFSFLRLSAESKSPSRH